MQVWKYANIQDYKNVRLKVYKFPSLQICNDVTGWACHNTKIRQVCKYVIIQLCKFMKVQVSKLQEHKYASIQVRKLASWKVYNMQVCKCEKYKYGKLKVCQFTNMHICNDVREGFKN